MEALRDWRPSINTVTELTLSRPIHQSSSAVLKHVEGGRGLTFLCHTGDGHESSGPLRVNVALLLNLLTSLSKICDTGPEV